MKNILTLTALSSALLLSACATQQMPPAAQTAPAVETTTVKPMAIKEPVSAVKMTSDMSSPSAKVVLLAKGQRLIAKIYTNWNGAKQGQLKLHWIAPPESNCISTTFPIMKYKETHDYSWAYRTLNVTIGGKPAHCSGEWQAEVIYLPTKQVVGSASINIPGQ
ncbi:MAG: TUL4 family lipoprotein [Francisellaceae bacterium]